MDKCKRILAIETSGRHGSVAALLAVDAESRLVRQVILAEDQRTAQTLAPAIKQLLAASQWMPESVDLVAVTVGPGSFTGLRIGVTTAKAFTYAAGCEVIGVNTLDVIAAQAPPSHTPLWAVSDAQRQELFAACYSRDENGALQTHRVATIIPQDMWLSSLRPGDQVAGPALRRLASRLPRGVTTAPIESWQPLASTVGSVGWRAYQLGRRDDLWKLVPNYYRASAAEEKRASQT
jgi:tRNA threonylcarbamoyladenosine biosynthesis protein TsaB